MSDKNTAKNLIFSVSDLEEIQYRLHGAIQLLRHSYFSIIGSGTVPDEHDFDALFSLFCYQQSLEDELSAKIDELRDSIYSAKNKTAQETSSIP